MHQTPLLSVLRGRIGVFIAGLVLGALGASVLLAGRYGRQRDDLRLRAVAAYRDLDQARRAQRDAQERAGKLEAELGELVRYARSLEDGSQAAERRAGILADHLDQARFDSGELQDDIERAAESLGASGDLLTELGSILRSVQERSGDRAASP